MPVHDDDRVSTFIAADPVTVWQMVSDVTRMGQWSPECFRALWLTPKRGRGAVFLGANSLGLQRPTVCS